MDAGGALGWSKPIWLGPGTTRRTSRPSPSTRPATSCAAGTAPSRARASEWWVQSFYPTGDERWINFSSGSASGDDICRAVIANASGVFAAGQITRTSSHIDGQLKKIVP